MTITGIQARAAREEIGLSQLGLAVVLQFGLRRIADFEAGTARLPPEVLAHLRSALEAAGIEFPTGGEPAARILKELRNDPSS